MLSPKRVKYRKRHKGRMTGMSHRGSKVSFGDFALQATECGWMTARQIEACHTTLLAQGAGGLASVQNVHVVMF